MHINIPKETQEVMEQSQYKIIATMLINGSSPNSIAKDLNLSRYFVNKAMKQDDFRAYLKEIAEQMVTTAANTWKAAMHDRISKALKVIDFKLEQNDLEAVKIIIKSIGIDKQEQITQASSLTVVLPDLNPTKSIEVESKSVEIEGE